MTKRIAAIPVIDLFAGPGGLGEGFSAYPKDGSPLFDIALSIEKDEFAHKTLLLRTFFRQFAEPPEDYYRFLRGDLTEAQLFELFPNEAKEANQRAWKAELGVVSTAEVDDKIRQRLKNCNDKWVLIGGPPCQAYSIIGRSRYSKIWKEEPEKRENDKRHFLYREYLRILAVHQPPVFVLENVKGLLSSTVSSGKISEKIFSDLKNPYEAISDALPKSKKGYRLFSIVREPRQGKNESPEFLPEDYIVRCEKYGVPQARHRIIILGIRDDLSVKPEILTEQKDHISVMNVIGDLPRLRSEVSKREHNLDWSSAIWQILHKTIMQDPIINKTVRTEISNQIYDLTDKLPRGGEAFHLRGALEPKQLKNWLSDSRLTWVLNHSTRSHIPADLRRYFFAACFARVTGQSPKLHDFPKALLPNHKNVTAGVEGIQFADRFRVQLAGIPSTTVTSHISKDGHYYIHYDPLQCRSLTVREAARLQTFPDNYFFMGNRTSQYHQVGNAVPPFLAYQLAEKVYKLLEAISSS